VARQAPPTLVSSAAKHGVDLTTWTATQTDSTPPIKPNLQEFCDQAMNNRSGRTLDAEALMQINMAARSKYNSAMQRYRQQLSSIDAQQANG
jgi:hypothetical protein